MPESRQRIATLMIGALPLYSMQECFGREHGVPPTNANVLGVVSLILWSLIVVVTIKYLAFIMRADRHRIVVRLRPRPPVVTRGIGMIGGSFGGGDDVRAVFPFASVGIGSGPLR